MLDYGKALRILRRHFNMTQKDLADKLNVTAQTVSKWENGVNQIDITYLQDLTALFGISVDGFLRLAEGQSLGSVINGVREEVGVVAPSAEAQTTSSATIAPSDGSAVNSGNAAVQTGIEKVKAIIKNNLPAVVTSVVLILITVAITITAICVNTGSGGGGKPRNELSASQIYEKVNPSVFYIEVTTDEGKQAGSGFFIDCSGTAVTNYHVIKGGSNAKITLPDGNEYLVEEVLGCDSARDLVLFKVDIGSSVAVERGDSNNLKTGDKVYAIGYPESFILGSQDSTFTDGIISKPAYNIDGVNYIQTTADITNGNSGGVLINSEGKVVGITTGKIDLGGVSYMNLALPVNNIGNIKSDINLPLSQFSSIYRDFTVTFMAGGEVFTQKEVTNGTKVPQAKGERQGYTFEGWYKDEELLTPFDFNNPIDGNTTIYGKWKGNTYYIEFLAEGATGQMERLEVEYGQSIALSANTFEKEGYDFRYWTSSEGGSTYYDGDTVINLTHENGKIIYFTALWEVKTCNIYYYVEGGMQKIKHVKWGEDVPEYKASSYGNHVEKWYSDEACTKEYVFGTANQTTINLYAKWTPNTYYIEFAANGGSGQMERQPVAYGEFATLNANQFTKKGYTFSHWSYNDDNYFDKSSIYCLAHDDGVTVTMTAVWEAITYKVEINSYNGSYYSLSVEEVSYEDTFTFPENELEVYSGIFLGWEYNGNVYPVGYTTSKMTDKDGATVEITALIRKVSFENPAGEKYSYSHLVDYRVTQYDVQLSISTPPTLGSNTFLGWKYKDKIYSSTDTLTGLTTDDQVMVLVSQWSVMNITCYFTEIRNSGEQVTTYTIASEFGKSISLPFQKYPRSGYTFVGWRLQGGSTVYSAGNKLGFSMNTSNSERYFEAVYESSTKTLNSVDEVGNTVCAEVFGAELLELNSEQLYTANFMIGGDICANECVFTTRKTYSETTV